MDTKVKIKQEFLLEIETENESESFPKEFAMKNNTTIEWYDDCEIGIKTEIKQEVPVTDFSQTNSQLVKNLKADICTYSNDMENDTKSKIEESLASDVCSENERHFFPEVLINKVKEYSNVSEIEIKEEPWWLERSYCEEIKDGRNEVELPRLDTEVVPQESALNSSLLVRNDISLNPKQDRSEIKETRKCDSDSDIRETFSIEESHYSQHPGRHKDGKIYSKGSVLQNHSYGCNINKKNITCKSTLVGDNLTDKRKLYNQLSDLKEHSSAQEAGNVHKCQLCERTFTQVSKLKWHNRIHKGVSPHKCEICDKTFSRMSSLKQHNLIHQGIKPHKCETCEKTFSNVSNLKQHNLIHMGVKPHKCGICERTFTYLSNLKQHNLIHEGVKSRTCEICGKTFTLMSSLKHHMVIHKEVKPHKCEICNKTFTQLANLKQHILIHKGVKPHKCKICEKSFTQMSSLKKHILIHEGKTHTNVKYARKPPLNPSRAVSIYGSGRGKYIEIKTCNDIDSN